MEDVASEVETRTRSNGPGLLEALVALAILVSLSGVLMPVVNTEVESRRLESAWADMQRIAEGLGDYSRDTLFLPTGVRGRTNVAWLYGPGAIPESNTFGRGGEARALADALLTDTMGGPGWGGPYLTEGQLGEDPWGRAYIVHADGWVNGRNNPYVVSAGPDGVLDTGPSDRKAGGDDLLYLLR